MAKFMKGIAALLAVVGVGSMSFTACEDSGSSSSKETEVTIEYRVEDGVIYCYKDGEKVVNGRVGNYHFNENGALEVVDEFVYLDGQTYYVEDSAVQYGFQVAYDRICYFDGNGVMQRDVTVDNYYIGEEGYLIADDYTEIVVEGMLYVIQDNTVGEGTIVEGGEDDDNNGGNVDMEAAPVAGTVYESDNDADNTNNAVLSNVYCTLYDGQNYYYTYTSETGAFSFADQFTNAGEGTAVLTFSLDGYIAAQMSVDLSTLAESLVIVMDREVSNTLMGKVTIADTDMDFSNNVGLSGATVILERTTSTNAFERTTTTDSYGNYTFTDLTAGVYSLTIQCDGYLEIQQTVTVRYNQTTVQNVAIEAISNTSSEMGTAMGCIKDAFTGNPIASVSVVIRRGINNTTGEIVKVVETNENGEYDTGDLEPGNYTGEVVDNRDLSDEDERYGSITVTIKIMPSVTIQEQNGVVSNEQQVSSDSIRVVLTWGETPSDLDSHLYWKDSDGENGYHVYYSHKTETNANLDVDDTSSYGPETITITNITGGTYAYYVHDYSNRDDSSSTIMANSGAKIVVYMGSGATPAYTLYVPYGAGTSWHVFTYNADTGDFSISNEISHINHPSNDYLSSYPDF